MRDTKPLLLILLSIGLVSTWVYHIYDKANYSRHYPQGTTEDSAAVASAINDSLNRIYSATITDLDTRLSYTRLNADSLQNTLEERISEINRLKSDIRSILDRQNLSQTDLVEARQKIGDLQQKVNALSDQNLTMEEERKQLTSTLEQLTLNVDTLQKNIRRLSRENETLNEKIALASTFVAYEIRLDAVDSRGSSEETTSQAKKTDKFIASFVVQNLVNQFSNAEITTVLIKPNGQVMQSTVWESGSFDTRNSGRKGFTRKIRFDYEKGEQKNLLFSIDTEKCDKGIYTFQVWHNGIMIGQTTKTLG